MKIKNIEINGWRSFDSEGIFINDLKKNNIFIGQNNSGKSNISKYFLRLKEISNQVTVDSTIRKNHTIYQNIATEFIESDSWAWLKNDITCKIEMDLDKTKWVGDTPFHTSNVVLKSLHSYKEKKNSLFVEVGGQKLISLKEPYQIYNSETGKHEDLIDKVSGIGDSFIFWKAFLDSLIFIDPIRHHERESTRKSDFYFDGAKIISELNTVKRDDRKEWGNYQNKIKVWVSKITNESIEGVDVISESKEFRLAIKRGKELLWASLDELGTGVAQIIMLLSHLYLFREKSLNVFLDEPESNLHPDAVIKLIEIFDNELPNHSFFITTHSSVLIDQIGDSWSIHRLTREFSDASQAYPCSTIVQKREVLDELGIRASQILQSNLIIWVEGPSDAIYVKKWISDRSNNSLIDGKHYSFIFYGGSNLSSHDFLSESENIVDFLFTSRYVVVFCDTDCHNQKGFDESKFKERVAKTISRLESLDTNLSGQKRSLKEFVKIWLTDGRETENYVPINLFKNVLTSKPFAKSWVNGTKGNKFKRIELDVKPELMDKDAFGQFDSFDCAFTAMYKRKDGLPLDDKIKTAISNKYSKDKVKIAKEIVLKWEEKHYSRDLKNDVEQLIQMIRTANGMEK